MLDTIEYKINGSTRVNEGLLRKGGVTAAGAFKKGEGDICWFKVEERLPLRFSRTLDSSRTGICTTHLQRANQ